MVYSLSRCPLVLSILPLLLLFTTSLSLSLSAQQLEHLAERPVGFAPGQLVVDPTTGMVHLLTNGQDTDFDGQLDSGEVSPAWYILDSKGVPIDSVIFAAHYNSFPTRVAFDFDGSHMWVLVGGELRSFDARTMAIIDTTVGIADMNGQGIAVPSLGSAVWDPGQGLLYLTKRAEDFVSAGEMIAFEPFDKRVVGRSRSGVNPNGGVGGVEVSALGLSRTWILNEGQANERNASLGLVGIAPDIYTAVNSGPLFPGGVERAAVFGDVAWLLVPRTREIVGIDRRSHLMQPASSFKLGDTVIPLALDADADRVTVVAAVDERRYLYIHDRTTGMLRPRLTLPTGTDRIATGGAEIYTLASPRGPDGGSDSVTIIDQPGAQNVTSLYAGPKPSNLWMRHDDEELVVVGNASQAGPAWYQRFEAETHDVIASGPIPVGGFQGDQSALDDDRGVLGFLFQGEGSLAISYLGELDLASGEIDTVWSALGYFPHRIAYGDGVWYLTNFPGDFVPEPTILVAVETESGEELSRSVVGESAPAIAIPSFSSVEGAHAVYTMATGGYGAAGTEMRYTEHHPNLFEGTLGDLGNHLMYEYFDCLGEDLAVVTLNNSHTIAIVELLDGAPAITNRVSTNTTGFDGPRATAPAPGMPAEFCGSFVTVSYDGFARLIHEGKVLDSVATEGRGEAIVPVGDSLFVANLFEDGTYSPAATMAILAVDWASSVNEPRLANAMLRVVPNPVVGDEVVATIRIEQAGPLSMRLLDLLGDDAITPLVARASAGERRWSIPVEGLASGTYLLRIVTPDGATERVVKVVR